TRLVSGSQHGQNLSSRNNAGAVGLQGALSPRLYIRSQGQGLLRDLPLQGALAAGASQTQRLQRLRRTAAVVGAEASLLAREEGRDVVMRVRITLRVAEPDRREVRVPASRLRQEANRIMEALLDAEEDGRIANLATETDATENSITVEAIVPSYDAEAAAQSLKSLLAPFVSTGAGRSAGSALTYEMIDSRAEDL
ncbi:hypothetical protein, partial [Micromonospora sp. LOL_023]|uniref:hypothetical protein n=1 Tax=Micromonospora sp. LOL_023 TaxID=3345418 RepID=UPI003A837C5F